MWLFTKNGFFSAVENMDDSSMIHVRARFKGDLERLAKDNELIINVSYTPDCDYPYRADISREDWVKVLMHEAKNIDYTNFKNAVHDGTQRDNAYFAVWSTMRMEQNNSL